MNASFSHSLWLVCSLVFVVQGAHAQREAPPINAMLCDLYRKPASYTGKVISVRASVAGNDLWIDDFEKACNSWIKVVVVLPNTESNPKLHLTRDESFAAFFDDLHKGMNIEATFEGRFDAQSVETKEHGFGKKHDARGQIVRCVFRMS